MMPNNKNHQHYPIELIRKQSVQRADGYGYLVVLSPRSRNYSPEFIRGFPYEVYDEQREQKANRLFELRW
jgi:hypothetical protein